MGQPGLTSGSAVVGGPTCHWESRRVSAFLSLARRRREWWAREVRVVHAASPPTGERCVSGWSIEGQGSAV
jgi:hypothetical protein